MLVLTYAPARLQNRWAERSNREVDQTGTPKGIPPPSPRMSMPVQTYLPKHHANMCAPRPPILLCKLAACVLYAWPVCACCAALSELLCCASSTAACHISVLMISPDS